MIFLQQEPTGCTIYFPFVSIINLYLFRAGDYVDWLLAGSRSCQQPVNIIAWHIPIAVYTM